MKQASDERTAISELQDEATKRKRQLMDSASTESRTTMTLSQTLSSFISSSSSSGNKGSASSSRSSASSAISSFVSSMKNGGGSSSDGSSSKDSSASRAAQATLSNFLNSGSGGSNSSSSGKGGKTQPGVASQETLGSFISSNDGSEDKNKKKSENKIDLSSLVANATDNRNAIRTIQAKSILENLKKNDHGERLDIYDALLKSLNINTDVIEGLDLFLASSAALVKPNNEKIDVSSEIVRTNFTIDNPSFIEKPDLENSGYYIHMDGSLANLPKIIQLQKSIKIIRKMGNYRKINRPKGKRNNPYSKSDWENLKAVDRTSKEYYIPNWAYEKDRNSIEMRVKQLNRLSMRESISGLKGIAPSENDFTKSLNSLLKFASTSDEDEKEGFNNAGMLMDELSQMRKKMSVASINNGHFNSNADNAIMEFDKYGFVTYNVGTLDNPLVLPSIDLGNFNISSKPLSARNGSYGISNPMREDFYHKLYSTSVEAMLRKTPDFRQNMYHGIFVYTIPDGIGKIQNFNELVTSLNGYEEDKTLGLARVGQNAQLLTQLTEAYEKIIKTYYVRMQGITIPGASIEPYSVPFLNRNIKKPGNNFTENHKITIDFTVDEMGLLVRSFNILTGNFGYIKDNDEHNRYVHNLFPVDFSPENKGRLDLVVTYNDFRVNPNFRDEDIPSKSNYMPATQILQSENDMVENRNGKQVYGDPRSYRQFVLEDVKILGLSNKLQFKRDDASKTTASVDIIFRRITTVDNNLTN